MNKLIIISLLLFVACSENSTSTDNVNNVFAGKWDMHFNSNFGMGSNDFFYIDNDGNFYDSVLIQAGKLYISGNVNNSGDLSNTVIRLHDSLPGIMTGSFSNEYPSGIGTQGKWTIGSFTEEDNLTWYARRNN